MGCRMKFLNILPFIMSRACRAMGSSNGVIVLRKRSKDIKDD